MGYSNLIICGDLKRIKPKRGPRTPPGSPPSSSSSERSSSFKKKRTRKSTSPESLEEKHRPQSGSGYKPSRWDTSPILSVGSSKSPEKTPTFDDVSTSSSLCVSPVTKEYEMVSSSSLDSPSPPPWPGERISRSRSPRERRSRSRSPRRIYPARSTSPLMVYLPESRHRTSQVDHSRNYKSYRTSAQRTPPHTSRRDQLSYVQYVEKQSQWNTLGKGENRQHSVSPFNQRRQGSPNRQIGLFNLPYKVSENDLREIYRRHGPIEEIRLIFDYETGMSRGFAFITFNHLRDATKALQATKGMKIDDRMIKADYAWGENVDHTSNTKHLSQGRRAHHISNRVSYTDGYEHSHHHEDNEDKRSPRYPGRPVITQNGRQLREPSNEIVVFNCPKSCTAEELHEIFKEFGLIREVTVARDRFTGQSRGFAFMTFDKLESAKRAIEKIVDSMEIGGRRLQCNYSWGQNRLPDAVQDQYGNRKKL